MHAGLSAVERFVCRTGACDKPSADVEICQSFKLCRLLSASADSNTILPPAYMRYHVHLFPKEVIIYNTCTNTWKDKTCYEDTRYRLTQNIERSTSTNCSHSSDDFNTHSNHSYTPHANVNSPPATIPTAVNPVAIICAAFGPEKSPVAELFFDFECDV